MYLLTLIFLPLIHNLNKLSNVNDKLRCALKYHKIKYFEKKIIFLYEYKSFSYIWSPAKTIDRESFK